MKRMTLIIAFIFIAISTLYQGNKGYAFDFEGMYLAPKISYYPENPVGKIWHHYAGAGVAAGFDLFRLKTVYPIPLRVEFEYMGRALATNADVTIHSVMFGAYYDLNLFYVRASELDTLSTKKVYTTKRPFMSIYIGMHLGAKIGYNVTDRGDIGLIQTNSGVSRTTILFGAGLGFAWHIYSWFTLDLGYRAVLGPGFKMANEVLLSFRFTKP